MKYEELKSKNLDELKGMLNDLRREQFNLRMQRGSGQLTQTHQFKDVRRNVARVKTAMGALKKS